MAEDLSRLKTFTACAGGRLYLGTGAGGLVLGHPEQAALILGPPRSGKTTGLAVPNVLAAPGAVVVTSTKPDLLAQTLPARSGWGRCWLFDPSGSVSPPPGVERIRWSPVAASSSWDDAVVVARSMAGAARPAGRQGESAHWTERAEALLAPLLHAAFLEGGGIEDVLGWVLRQSTHDAASVLQVNQVSLGCNVLAGLDATDPREMSGIWSSAAGILAAYRFERVLDNSTSPNFDPFSLRDSCDTVYVCAPARHQDLVAPIVVAFLDRARAGAYADAGAWAGCSESLTGGRGLAPASRAPLTLVLDELANVAPIPDLPSLVSEGGSQGVLVLGVLQDLSQARQRWGAQADGFLSLFGAKVVLPGIADMQTLDLVSRLGGEVDIPARSVSSGPWWGRNGGAETVTWAGRRQRRLPVDVVSQQPAGTALLLEGASPPRRVGIPHWHVVPPFRDAVPAPSRSRSIDVSGRGASL